MKYLTWLTCFLGLLYTCGFVLFVIIELAATTTNLYTIFLNLTASSSENGGGDEQGALSTMDILCTLMQRASTSTLGAILLTFWLSMAITVESVWVIFLLMTALWGFYFKQLLAGCIHLIETHKVKIPHVSNLYVNKLMKLCMSYMSFMKEQFFVIFFTYS